MIQYNIRNREKGHTLQKKGKHKIHSLQTQKKIKMRSHWSNKKRKKMEMKRKVSYNTGITSGNGGSGSKITWTRSSGPALVVAVEGIRSVSLNGVREKTESIWLKRKTIPTGPTSIVQRRLQCVAAGVTPRYTPARCSSLTQHILRCCYYG